MTTRWLRSRSPLIQCMRYASTRRSEGTPLPRIRDRRRTSQKIVNERVLVNTNAPAGGTQSKATYEPSPIFSALKSTKKSEHVIGKVKPTAEEALKKPISRPVAQVKKSEKPKEPAKSLTEDEKTVYMFNSFLTHSTYIRVSS